MCPTTYHERDPLMRPAAAAPLLASASLLVLLLAGAGGAQPGAPGGVSAGAGIDARPLLPVADLGWLGHGVCYGPHRDGQRPGGPSPSAAQIREDLHLMAGHWDLIRIFGASGFGRAMLEQIVRDQLELKVMVGAWIDAESERDDLGEVVQPLPENVAANEREVAAAIALARDFPEHVIAVAVGNETQVSGSPYACDLDVLVGHVRSVREAVPVPVTTADDWRYWTRPESHRLAAELDFVLVHAHPLWEGQQLADAMPWLQARLAELQAMHPSRLVVIGETGWATDVPPRGEQAAMVQGAVGEAEQSVFYHASREWARSERLPMFTFEAFDENWKGGDHPRDVEKHWGLFRADRTPKAAISLP